MRREVREVREEREEGGERCMKKSRQSTLQNNNTKILTCLHTPPIQDAKASFSFKKSL